jgi:hypothetical protein
MRGGVSVQNLALSLASSSGVNMTTVETHAGRGFADRCCML